jgi:hypothetical protein
VASYLRVTRERPDCLRASLYTAALLDGILTANHRRILATHVEACRRCKRVLLVCWFENLLTT